MRGVGTVRGIQVVARHVQWSQTYRIEFVSERIFNILVHGLDVRIHHRGAGHKRGKCLDEFRH